MRSDDESEDHLFRYVSWDDRRIFANSLVHGSFLRCFSYVHDHIEKHYTRRIKQKMRSRVIILSNWEYWWISELLTIHPLDQICVHPQSLDWSGKKHINIYLSCNVKEVSSFVPRQHIKWFVDRYIYRDAGRRRSKFLIMAKYSIPCYLGIYSFVCFRGINIIGSKKIINLTRCLIHHLAMVFRCLIYLTMNLQGWGRCAPRRFKSLIKKTRSYTRCA